MAERRALSGFGAENARGMGEGLIADGFWVGLSGFAHRGWLYRRRCRNG